MSETRQESGRTGGIVPWNALRQRSAAAFLLAGAFLVGFAVRNGVIAFGGGFTPRATGLLYVAFVVPAELAAYAGLLGLYPRLSDRTPWLAGAGGVIVGIAVVAVVGFGAGATVGLLSTAAEPSPVADLLYLVMLLATVLAFVLFGASGLRSGERTVGLVLLGPPAIYVLMFVTGAMAGGEPPAWSTFAVSAVQAGAHLLIGVRLRSEDGTARHPEPAAA